MREFNKLFVIALPRCATVSMSHALGLLGIPIAHLGKIYGETGMDHHDSGRLTRILEQVLAGDYRLDILDQCRGLADYPCCDLRSIRGLDQAYPGSLFVNIQRRDWHLGWLQSIETQLVGMDLLADSGRGSAVTQDKNVEPTEVSSFVSVLRRFRERTFGSSSFEPEIYLQAYRDYQRGVADYFAGRQDLLDFADVSLLAREGFSRLGHFLGIDSQALPTCDFPNDNQHSKQPGQAFFKALQAGRIQSRTGIVIN